MAAQVKHLPPKQRWRAAVFRVVESKQFELAAMAAIVANCLIMALMHADISPVWEEFMAWSNISFTAFFTVEIIAKFVAYGFKSVVRVSWWLQPMYNAPPILAQLHTCVCSSAVKQGGRSCCWVPPHGVQTLLYCSVVQHPLQLANSPRACVCPLRVEPILLLSDLLLQDAWCRFDLLVVVVSLLGVAVDVATPTDLQFLPLLRVLRVVRIFRLVPKAEGLRVLLRTLFMSLPGMCGSCAELLPRPAQHSCWHSAEPDLTLPLSD